MKIAVGGGPAQVMCDATNARGGEWNRDNVIVFSQSGNSARGLHRVTADGGVPEDAVASEGVYRYPTYLPDDDHLLFTDIRPGAAAGIYLASLKGGSARHIVSDRSAAVFAEAAPGSLQGHVAALPLNVVINWKAELTQVRGR